MKGKLKKRQYIIFALLFIAIFSCKAVFAAEISGCPGVELVDGMKYCDSTQAEPGSPEVKSRYGLVLKNTSGDTYTFSMGKDNRGCSEGVGFKIESVNGDSTNPAVGTVIECGKPATLTATANLDNDFGLPGVYVMVRSTKSVKKDFQESDDKTCYFGCVVADVYTTKKGAAGTGQGQVTIPVPTTYQGTGKIDCDNQTYGADTFEGKFCASKAAAIAAGNVRDFGTGYYTGDPTKFKCDYKIENVPANTDSLEGDAYFVNKKYLYGKTLLTETATIVHHYYPGVSDADSKETISCEIECEETVDVEYGPPVATQAGVCFEYRVRATSRTACHMTKEPDKTNLCKTSYCEPYPQCEHGVGGAIYTQAGPNDQFDACIRECDGGKYTKKCNNKCYKSIYGSIIATAKVNSTLPDIVASKVNQFPGVQGWPAFTCEGYFSFVGNDIKWYGDGGYAPGRWYCSSNWISKGKAYCETFWSDTEGFFRKERSGGTLCNATCTWNECGKKDYLNETVPCDKFTFTSEEDKAKYCKNGKVNVLQYDCDKNTEAYDDLVRRCESKSSCSTETAEFTISVDYTKLGKTTETTIGFPYKDQKDTISYSSSAIVSTQNQPNTTLLPDYPDSSQGILGCYKDAAKTNLYRATWGFPNTWQNIKTGEYSYNYNGKTNTEGGNSIWMMHPHRFCLPGDAKGVNVLWYNAYMKKVGEATGQLTTTTVYVYEDRCKYLESTYSVVSNCAQYITSESSVKYNIHAKTRQFGYLQWDIDVDCFYAANDDPLCEVYENDECKTEKKKLNDCTPTGEVRIHTVDLTDLFPNENGATLSDPSHSGRIAGYNWSEYAINDKNTDYKSNPVAYMTKLQSSADSMYSDANLDYEFYLSPKTIREMRKANVGASVNYTAFRDGDFKVDERTGVSRYTSSKIHDNAPIPASDKKVPPVGSAAISCNNMVSWNNYSSCDSVHG